jgi:hypothetical protein
MNPKKNTYLNLVISLVLQSLFARSGKTFENISKETGMTCSNLSRTVNFERAVTYQEVCSLCGCFGITVSHFQILVEDKMRTVQWSSDLMKLKYAKNKSRL